MFITLIPHGLLSINGLCKGGVLPAAVTRAELLLGLEAGEGVLVVRDISEASRRGSLAGCSSLVVALAQLPPWWAVRAIQPGMIGRAAGSLLYPSKCSAWSHGTSQQNLPGVKRKKRDRKGTRDKGRNKVKKCAVKLLAAKCGESHFQLLSSQRWSH